MNRVSLLYLYNILIDILESDCKLEKEKEENIEKDQIIKIKINSD